MQDIILLTWGPWDLFSQSLAAFGRFSDIEGYAGGDLLPAAR